MSTGAETFDEICIGIGNEHASLDIRRRKERREKREERKWPQARFTAFLQGPVATSKKFGKSEGGTKMAASSIHSIFTGCRGHLDEGQKIKKKNERPAGNNSETERPAGGQ